MSLPVTHFLLTRATRKVRYVGRDPGPEKPPEYDPYVWAMLFPISFAGLVILYCLTR